MNRTTVTRAPLPKLAISTLTRPCVLLAIFSLCWAWGTMSCISRHDPWYRNTDMNVHNVADAISLNAGYSVGTVDQPATATKFLLALDFRIRNALGLLPVWQVKRFARSPEPLRDLARLIRAGREHNRALVMLLILAASVFVGQVTRRVDTACLAIMLLCGASGLLFHGLLLRPELLCTLFGGVLAPYAVWIAGWYSRPTRRFLWLCLSGFSIGVALLAKLAALYYLLLLLAWVIIYPSLTTSDEEIASDTRRAIATCLLAGSSSLVLLLVVGLQPESIDPIASARLRFASVVIALLPLGAQFAAQSPTGRFIRRRVLAFSALLAGALLAVPLCFGMLRTILPASTAAAYMAKILNTVFYPDALVKIFTQEGMVHRLHEMGRFLLETPALFTSTSCLVAILCILRGIPRSIRSMTLLLLAQGIGMVVMMSKRQFTDQYGIFAHVPLLVIWPIGLAGLDEWWRNRVSPGEQNWPVALVASGAIILVAAMPLALAPKYNRFQNDASLPVSDLTVTFLYDHAAHPQAYLDAMKRHYPTRREFVEALDLFLLNPANRE